MGNYFKISLFKSLGMAIKEECERLWGITLPELSVAYNFLIMLRNEEQIPAEGVPAFPLRNGVGEHTSP